MGLSNIFSTAVNNYQAFFLPHENHHFENALCILACKVNFGQTKSLTTNSSMYKMLALDRLVIDSIDWLLIAFSWQQQIVLLKN